MIMKKILASVAVVLGTVGGAQAADMAVKAPYLKAPVAMVYDWTGFYIGVNAGVGIGRDYTRLAVPAGLSFEASYLNPQGGLGGGQVGYNYQTASSFFGGPLVFGVEADIQGTGMRDNFNCLIGCLVGLNNNFNQRLEWFGTVRGRVGIATGPVLSYVTGGWAYGSVKTTLTETVGTTGTFTSNQNRGGWVYGAGVEASLGGNWTGKIEYLYLNLGDRLDQFTLNGFAQAMSTDIREQIFRVGLNYRIGGNGGAYVPPPASNWAGFYLGGNFGGGIGRDHTAFTFSAVGTATELFNLSPDGYNGGVQAGYNWQAANWVFGLEADIQASSQRDNRACVQTCNPLVAPVIFAAYDARLPWFGTARGRIGYSVGSSLFYATGGYAYGRVKTNITTAFLGAPVSAEISSTRSGWTVGGGIETPFTFLGIFGPNWTSKTEYLYVDLGTSTGAFPVPTFVGGPVVTATNSTQVHEHIFRTGLNYHFNSPVVAKY
jgi:outer membrane immunogenic protein